MTQRDFVFSVADFLKGNNRNKVFADINALYPLLVMVPDNKVLFTFQALQIVLQILDAKHQIANDINDIISMNTYIPVINPTHHPFWIHPQRDGCNT